MDRKELYKIRKEIVHNRKYIMCYWANYNYTFLQNIMYVFRSGRGDNTSYDDCIIMLDTETSKKYPDKVDKNHVVAFTISIRAFDHNIVTLWGRRPDDAVKCVTKIMENLSGDHTVIYVHNLSYDYVFLRQFFFKEYGLPVKQLNVKPHYPIFVEFENGLIIKDSLILSGCSLDKWAKDLDVEHKKVSGKWDYERKRGQSENFSKDELEYIEHDTLAGIECIDALLKQLNKKIFSIPYTMTGIPREECYKRGVKHHAHDLFEKLSPDYELYHTMEESLFHGGYVHADRHLINEIIELVKCFDFTSSYPFCLLAFKYPMTRFEFFGECDMDTILKLKDKYAFMFKLILYKFKLEDPFESMPVLQYSKAQNMINCVNDNGRLLCGAYAEIYVTEQDLEIIKKQYKIEKHMCVEVYYAEKDYLPRWFTDYVYELFKNKCMLKGGDPVDYSLAKGKLNSLYGMCVQKAIQKNIEEDYETGDFIPTPIDEKAFYEEKYINNRRKILPYAWGVWCTSYAMNNLFKLFDCVSKDEDNPYKYPIYADTDSCYAHEWNYEMIDAYNESCKQKLLANGYGPVVRNGKEYWLGVAVSEDFNDEYYEFKVQGAKRYCGLCKRDYKIHITVAGVPKKGAKCLKENISNFEKGFIFPGVVTGKKTHTYFFNDIYTDEEGNLTGDSIDLSPCDYLLDDIAVYDFEKIYEEEIEVQTYEEL